MVHGQERRLGVEAEPLITTLCPAVGGMALLAVVVIFAKRLVVAGTLTPLETLGLALVGFAFSRSWYFSLAVAFIIGVAQTGRMTVPMALLQHYTAAEYRGRVTSFYGMEMGFSSFGAFFAGILVPVIGVHWAVGGLAMVLIVLSLLVWFFIPRLRNLD